jgi:hypothetical protein
MPHAILPRPFHFPIYFTFDLRLPLWVNRFRNGGFFSLSLPGLLRSPVITHPTLPLPIDLATSVSPFRGHILQEL